MMIKAKKLKEGDIIVVKGDLFIITTIYKTYDKKQIYTYNKRDKENITLGSRKCMLHIWGTSLLNKNSMYRENVDGNTHIKINTSKAIEILYK